MSEDKFNLWQLILHTNDVLDFKVLETKILLFKELVDQGHASEMVKLAIQSGKINISAEFIENDVVKKILLKDVDVLNTKSKYGKYILSDILVSDVLIDGVSIFETSNNTGK